MPATLERTSHAEQPAHAVSRPSAQISASPARPVFASETQRRARALRVVGLALAALTALWLTALVLGAFGLHPLPGVDLPRVPGGPAAPGTVDRPSSEAGAGRLTRTQRSEEGSSATPGAGAAQAKAKRVEARREAARRAENAPPGTGDATGRDASPDGSSGVTTTPPTPSATAPVPATPTNGNSDSAPGAVNRPDRSAETTPPGNSGTAPGRATSGDRRGGPRADATSP